MSDEIANIIAQNAQKILENTIPEKRQENEELLNSIMTELSVSVKKIEENLARTLEQIRQAKD